LFFTHTHVAATNKIQRVVQKLIEKAEPLSSSAEIQETERCLETVELWLSKLRERCRTIYIHMDKASDNPTYGKLLWDNYKAAIKAYPYTMRYGGSKLEIYPCFGSQINEAQVPDSGHSDYEADEDLIDEMNGDLEIATHTNEMPIQDVENDRSDIGIGNNEAGQQRDLENEEVVDENMEDEHAAEGNHNEDLDEDVTIEIHDKRSGGTQRKVLKVAITLRY
jgi:hypothetical protein